MASIGLFLVVLIQISHIRTWPTLIDEIWGVEDEDVIDLSRFGDAIFGDPDERVGRMVDEWTPESNVNAEELGTYFEGDILIPHSESRNGLVKESSRWKNNVVPYVFHSSISSSDRSLILKAIDEYHKKTCIKFVPRSTEKDYLSFESSNSGCWSSVGRIGGKQTINLQSGGCTRIGTIEHEMMHALGFLHEQNRYDRDDHVIIYTENIKPETLPNFDKARAGETTAYGVTYDKGSVMHYSPTAFSKNGQKTIVAKDSTGEHVMGQRKGFSESDLAKIRQRYCPSDSLGPSGVGDRHPNYIDYNAYPDYGYPNYPGQPDYGYPNRPPFGPNGPPVGPVYPQYPNYPGQFGRPPLRPQFGRPPFGRPPFLG